MEVERFDRHDMWGGSPIASLRAVNMSFIVAASTHWIVLAQRLKQLGLIDESQVQQIARLWWFGRLIGNTDMHLGNLSFRPDKTLAIAPAYDTLPMMYAPLSGGEVTTPAFTPPRPLPKQEDAWREALPAALTFWQSASTDPRISANFRAVCRSNAQALRQC